jgi:hypothetical protein
VGTSESWRNGRERVTSEIAEIVRRASGEDTALDAAREAVRLLKAYPACGWTVAELARMIAELAVTAGAAVELSELPPHDDIAARPSTGV